MKEVMTIGIAGGSASGKTSISKQIKKIISPESSFQILKMDDYYKDQTNIDLSERVKVNYDHPFAFDTDLLVEQLKRLKNKERVEKPIYDYSAHTRSDKTEIIEGICKSGFIVFLVFVEIAFYHACIGICF